MNLKFGSSNSHTAILARTMGIPALIGVDIDEEWNGKTGIIDGFEGKLIVDPDEAVMNDYVKKQEAAKEQKKLLQSLKGKDTVTKSGKQIKLYGFTKPLMFFVSPIVISPLSTDSYGSATDHFHHMSDN